jgi:hypothetical protein
MKTNNIRFFLILILAFQLQASTYFEDGVEAFQKGNYEVAFKIFSDLAKNSINYKSDIDLYLARSALETGRFFEALIAFERILIEVDERDIETINLAKFGLANTHVALGEIESAKNLYFEILENSPPPYMKEKVINILQIYQNQKKDEEKLNIDIGVSIGQENLTQQINSEKSIDKKSIFHQEYGYLSYSKFFAKSSFIYTIGLLGVNKSYLDELSDKSLTYEKIFLSPGFKNDNLKVELPLSFENLIDENDNLLSKYTISMKLSKFLESEHIKAILFETLGGYSYLDYKINLSDADLYFFGLGVTTKYQAHRFSFKTLSELQKSNQHVIKNHNLIEKIMNTIHVQYNHFNKKFNYTLNYIFKNTIFDDFQAIKDAKDTRQDIQNIFEISFNKDFYRNWDEKIFKYGYLEGEIKFSYIKNNSNYAPAKYEAFSSEIGVKYKF